MKASKILSLPVIWYNFVTDCMKNTPDIDECVNFNGGCDHVCKNNIGSHDCLCNNGHLLEVDKRSCKGNSIVIKITKLAIIDNVFNTLWM